MTTISGQCNDLEEIEIRCQFCDFLVAFGTGIAKVTCIYCVSEREFFRATFDERGSEPSVYANSIDKTPWRRGLMFDRKNAIRTWYEVLKDEPNDT